MSSFLGLLRLTIGGSAILIDRQFLDLFLYRCLRPRLIKSYHWGHFTSESHREIEFFLFKTRNSNSFFPFFELKSVEFLCNYLTYDLLGWRVHHLAGNLGFFLLYSSSLDRRNGKIDVGIFHISLKEGVFLA